MLNTPSKIWVDQKSGTELQQLYTNSMLTSQMLIYAFTMLFAAIILEITV